MAKRTSIVLFVAAVVIAAVLALYAFPRGPRVMAVEFDGTWAGAVLEGNEIVPSLVEMGDGHLAGGYDGYAPEPGSEQLTPEQLESCWNVLETKTVPKGWRERLTPR